MSVEKLGRKGIRLVGILRKLWFLKISLNEAKEETEMERQRNNERQIGGKSKERRREIKQPKKKKLRRRKSGYLEYFCFLV